MIDPGTLSGERLAVLIEHALLSGTKEQKKPAAAAADLLDDAMSLSSGTVVAEDAKGNENAIYAPGNQPSNLHHNGGFGTEFDSAAVDQTSAYEFRALEAVLTFQSAELDHRLSLLLAAADSVLSRLDGAENESLQRLLQLKSSLAAFEVQIKEFREAVDDLSEDQVHLSQLYLSVPVKKGDPDGTWLQCCRCWDVAV